VSIVGPAGVACPEETPLRSSKRLRRNVCVIVVNVLAPKKKLMSIVRRRAVGAALTERLGGPPSRNADEIILNVTAPRKKRAGIVKIVYDCPVGAASMERSSRVLWKNVKGRAAGISLHNKKPSRIASSAGFALTEKSFGFPKRKPEEDGLSVTLPNKTPLRIASGVGAASKDLSLGHRFRRPKRSAGRWAVNATIRKKQPKHIVAMSVGAASTQPPG
jgi:hypothetical protein